MTAPVGTPGDEVPAVPTPQPDAGTDPVVAPGPAAAPATPPSTAPSTGRRRAVQTLAGAALLITAVTLASRVVGFGRWLAQGAWLGSDGVGQVFNAANMLPNILFEVAAGGALAGAVVPLLAGHLSRADAAGADAAAAREAASRNASALLGWTLVVLVPLGALLAALAGPIATTLNLDDPDKVAVATTFLRVFAVQVPLYGVAVVLGGILQAHKRFFWQAFAPLVSSVVVIGVYAVFGVLAAGSQADVTALSPAALGWLAWGTTVGVAFLALPLVVPARRTGLRLRPTLRFPAGEGRRAARLAFAGVGALVAQQLSVYVALLVANRVGGPSSYAVFLYTQQVYLLPYAVLAFPIATSAFPRIAEHAAHGRSDDLRALVASTTRTLLLVVAVGIAALVAAAPAVEGVFDLVVRGDAPGMAAGLTWMAAGLVGYALILHLSRALYAIDRGRAAVVATAAGWLVVAAGAASLRYVLPLLGAEGPPYAPAHVLAGLGGATTLGMLVAAAGLLLAVRRHVGGAALHGVPRALVVLTVGVGLGALAGRGLLSLLGRGVPAGPGEVTFDAAALVADLGAGVLVAVVAVAVVVLCALADPALRSGVRGLRRR
ncbi:murein biosynthesis integral membrane protein MurJ [Puerhibacterium puerhi]|uniref:murein biosynthesis integral membrane protein MurJ n=1 Tax=Puerhibacterium puerhi TaxID=2692623 RepID=UPI001F38EE42|nr:lipid II flippase MurJ [Puerhibacterium puerhi]